jgi:molecular chaperone HscB
MNYFELFEIKPTYFLNLEQVSKKFYELSRVLHPDKFQNKSTEELMEATRQSAVLNSAFKVLKDDDERAHYLFEIAQFNWDQTKTILPPELAEEYFNLQEALEQNDNGAQEYVKNFSALLQKEINLQNEFQKAAFNEWEKANSPLDDKAIPYFAKAAKAIQQKNYIRSMALDLEKKWPT